MYAGAPPLTARLAVGDVRLDVTIIDYQFPDLVSRHGTRIDNDYDANGLDAVVSVNEGVHQWRVPFKGCLFNWEVPSLAQWIQRVADGYKPRWAWSGIEAVPEFNLSDDRAWLGVTLRVENWPDEVRIPFDAAALHRFSSELRSEVAPFPLRVLEENGAAHRATARLHEID